MGKSEGHDEPSSDASTDASHDTPQDSSLDPTPHPTPTLSRGAAKPRWRRLVEVAVPVAAFAIVVPFAVNGLASAVNSGDSSASSASSSTSSTTSPVAAAESTTSVAAAEPTTTLPAETTTAVPVTVANAAPDADDRTISLASEIISELPADATATTAAETSTDDDTTTTVAAGHSHGGVHPEVALTRDERKQLGLQLLQARNAAAQFPTVADALAGGYTMVTGYVPLIGAHYIKWSLMDGTFDVNQPEMLLYDGTDPTSSIVGLSYYVFSDTEPSPFVGPNDHWHQHIGLCIKDGVVVGGESTTVAECAARGGAKANVGNGWMVHAWVVPGWESPQGVFSPEHSGLTADLPTS